MSSDPRSRGACFFIRLLCACVCLTKQNLQLNVVKHGAVFIDVAELVARRMSAELKSGVPIGHEEVVVHSGTEQIEEAIKHLYFTKCFYFLCVSATKLLTTNLK